MKKTLIISLPLIIIISALIYYVIGREKNDSSIANKVADKNLEVKPKISAARKKAIKTLEERNKKRNKAQNHENTRELSTKEKQIIKQAAKAIGLADINQQMLAAFSQLTTKNSQLHDFIKNFPFQKEFEKELAKLDEESLRVIGELEEHPISKELSNTTKETSAKIEEFINTGESGDISQEKQHLIDQITSETSVHESTQELVRNMIESTTKYAIVSNDSKINNSEAELIALEQANAYVEQQADTLRTITDMSYSGLTNEQLEEYSRFLQKINAREATSLSTRSLEPVFYRFNTGLIQRLKK